MGLFSSLATSLGLREQRTFGGIDVPTLMDLPTIVNEIFGITSEVEEFERADGTKGTRIVTKGATPEQEAFISTLQDRVTQISSDINSLSDITAAIENEAFSPVVEAQRTFQQQAREQAFKDRSRLEEEVLARRGLGDSTSAIEAREQRGADLQDQIVQDELSLTLLAEDLRNQALQRQAGNLQIQSGLQSQLGQAGAGTAGQQAALGQLQLGQGQLGLSNEAAVFQSRLGAQQAQGQALGQTITGLTGFFGNPFSGLGGSISGLFGGGRSPNQSTNPSGLGLSFSQFTS